MNSTGDVNGLLPSPLCAHRRNWYVVLGYRLDATALRVRGRSIDNERVASL